MRTETQRLLAEKQINSSTLMAAGCGAIPVSYVDIGSTVVVQMNMMKNLCDIYEVKWDDHAMKGLLASAVGNIGKRTGASMLKSIPIVGTILGGFANATLSGISTYAMGHAFVKYMKMNNTVNSLKDIDLGVMSSMGVDILKRAGDVANTIKEKVRSVKEDVGEASSGTHVPIFARGEKAFGGKDKFNAWLNTKNPILGGAKPIELLLSSDESENAKLSKLIDLCQQEQATNKN